MNVLFAFLLLIMLLVTVMPLLVMFIALCIKKPKIAALFALVPVAVFVIFYATMYIRNREPSLSISVRIPKQSSPIWLEGIDQQFEADVYPSQVSAVQSISKRIGEQFHRVMIDSQQPDSIVVVQNSWNFEFVELLRDSILKQYPEIKCRIDDTVFPSQENEVGILLELTQGGITHVSRGDSIESGTFHVTISNENRNTMITANFVEKPWVENFSSFTNSQPNKQYMVAKSSEGCMAPEEAEQQAMDNACKMFGPLLLKRRDPIKINSNDIIHSGLIVDKFLQSLDGSAGKIWRQAILLDVSPEKINRLAEKIAGVTQARRERRLSTVGSILGLFVLITIVYIFLNAATRGYYAWSLRIAGVVLALILIFLLLA